MTLFQWIKKNNREEGGESDMHKDVWMNGKINNINPQQLKMFGLRFQRGAQGKHPSDMVIII